MKRNDNIIRIINVIWSNINQDLTLNEILSCLCVQCFHAMFVFRCSHNLCVICWQKSAQTGGAVYMDGTLPRLGYMLYELCANWLALAKLVKG